VTYPTETEHFAAIKALLTAAVARPYDYGETIPSGTTAYNLLTVSERFAGVERMTSQIGTRSMRVTVRSVGTTMDNVREMRKRQDAALRDVSVTVAGRSSTPIHFETAEIPARDGDVVTTGTWFSALTSWTYSI
jgi:hypothetical protein